MSQPQFANEETKSSESIWKVCVAIDFGTDGIGVAYAYDNRVQVHDKWRSKNYGIITKPKTIILLDDEGETAAVGLDAKHAYMNLNGKQKDDWMLFERFKMSLYAAKLKKKSRGGKSQYSKLAITNQLTATNGKKYSSGKVFIAAFRHIHKISKKYLRKQKIKVSDDEIQFIISVPSIWNDEAKHKMKQWALKAGLYDEDNDDQCRVVYEPDCASLAIQHHLKGINIIRYETEQIIKLSKKRFASDDDDERKEDDILNQSIQSIQQVQSPFADGDKYILVDAGGGTVDIACHQVVGEFGVKEIFHPTGGPWGSCYIDDQYVKLLERIFGTKAIDEFKKELPNIYVELIHYFQDAKASFLLVSNSIVHCVKLPYKFLSFMEEYIARKSSQKQQKFKDSQGQYIDNKYAKDKIKAAIYMNQNAKLDITEDTNGQYLEISMRIWKDLFDHVIDPTVKHIQKLLNQPSLMRKCKYLCLVGGLSCSAYFQYRMKQEFGPLSKYLLIIITPNRPILSVVAGAAYFGITRDYVKARRLRYSYGIIGRIPKSVALANKVPMDHIKKYGEYDKFWGQDIVRGCVKVFGWKNEEINLNQVKTIDLKRNDQNGVIVENIIRSDLDDPKTKDDGEIIGTLEIPFSDQNKDNLDIVTEFHFAGTVIKVLSYPKKTPHLKQHLPLKYNDV